MSMVITHLCQQCSCPLTLDCGEIITKNEHGVDQLDLTLECGNCDAPIFNAFIPLTDFQPLE